MTEGDNADAKWSENQLEGEESERTVNCLRGRLLAERMASRNAREQAEKLGNKLMELESLLKEEAKSRNRAEKKLKSLMKKLPSLNLSFSTDESSQLDKAEISSVSSSTASSNSKDKEKSHEQKENCVKSLKVHEIFQQNDSQECLLSLIHGSSAADWRFEVDLPELKTPSAFLEILEQGDRQNASVKEILVYAGKLHSEKPTKLNSDENYNNLVSAEQCIESCTGGIHKQEDDQDLDNQVDNSLALVSVDVPPANQAIDPEVLDGTVKEVLDTLRHAKEQLQSSMERRRARNMIKVG